MPPPRAFADLHAQARRHARRPDEADDLLQSALLAALESGRTDLAAPETRRWLSGVIRNRAAFDARTSARRRRRENGWSETYWPEPALGEQAAQRRSVEPRTGEATLPALPPALRLTALLALSGHTRREIGWLLNLSDTALRQRISQLKRALAAAPALFLLAGFDADAVRGLFARAFAGFRIGGVVISLTDIVFAILAFVAILGGTRLVQGGLQRGPLAHTRMDAGAQNSLVTLLGYVGLVIAASTALSIAGVDLSNLALIAGALSVGIGFGLQSVVNNFVSGLILLFERPVKVGDWIVTQSGEGIVKKISVRSTEIETFDRSSIIIPNSELVTQTVTNWTHKNNMGRVRIAVGVAYDSDPALVRELLLKCADENPLVVRFPEPFVTWEAFGASSLDFELRCFLSDIGKGLQARTELRFAIFKAFKENGIEFPYAQQDVYVRAWPEDRKPEGVFARPAAGSNPAPPRLEPEDPELPEDD